MVDEVFKIGDFILVNKLFNSFGDEVTIRIDGDGGETPIDYSSDCNIEWINSGLNHYNNYIFKCIKIIPDSEIIVIRIIEKDIMKETKYTITCHKDYLEIDKKRNRMDTIGKLLNI